MSTHVGNSVQIPIVKKNVLLLISLYQDNMSPSKSTSPPVMAHNEKDLKELLDKEFKRMTATLSKQLKKI